MRGDVEIDILALAQKAQARGYHSPEQAIKRLEKIIRRDLEYISRPDREGLPFNRIIEEDAWVLAWLIVLLESVGYSTEETEPEGQRDSI